MFSPHYRQPLAEGGARPHTSRGFLQRVWHILLAPRAEWPLIASETTTIGQLYAGYVAPMAAWAALMCFIRLSIIGVNLPSGAIVRLPFANGLVSAFVSFVLALPGLYLIGLIANLLAPLFAGQRDQRQALKLAAYALTPAWLATALTLLPMGSLLQRLAALYGAYLLYLGVPRLMRSKPERSAGYATTIFIFAILIGILFGVVCASLGAALRS